MESIQSRCGTLSWNILHHDIRQTGKSKRSYFTVQCSKCGYQHTTQKIHIQNRVACPGCSEKPAALKTDDSGNCLTICEIGTVEFIKDYQDKHNVSERAAVRQFIETVKQHLPTDDPMAGKLTEDSVNAKFRRLTGKTKETSTDCVGSTQNNTNKEKRKYVIRADLDSVQKFLNKYLPDYELVHKQIDAR